jgi:hypothetical protein
VTVPPGMAYRLPAGADFILQTHFHPTGKEEREISSVGLHFADEPPPRSFTALMLPPIFGMFAGLDIPPDSNNFTIQDAFELPFDVEAFGITAHAHYLGQEVRMTAKLPSGQSLTLLWIKDRDFSWQEQYVFEEFVTLPKGTRLHVAIRYDNTANNPANPFNPPQRVKWGRGSYDEMGCVTINVAPVNGSELDVLNTAYEAHLDDSYLKVALAEQSHVFRNMFQRMDRDKDGMFDHGDRLRVRDFLKRNGFWTKLPGFQPPE